MRAAGPRARWQVHLPDERRTFRCLGHASTRVPESREGPVRAPRFERRGSGSHHPHGRVRRGPIGVVRLGCGHHAANVTGVRPQAASDGRPASHVVPAEAEHRSTSSASTRRIGRNASDAGLLAPTTVTGPPSKIVAQGVFGVPCLGSFMRPRRGRVAKYGREPVLGPRAARLRCRLNDGGSRTGPEPCCEL